MAKLKQHGDNPDYILQSDYQFSHNGYGLLQLTVNYAIDASKSGGSTVMFARGDGFYSGSSGVLSKSLADYAWTCVKAEERGRDGNIAYITAHFAAIEDGSYTETEASLTSSAVSEPIESHPNFTKIQIKGIGDGKSPLGGIWTGNTPPSVNTTDEATKNKFRAVWGPITGSAVGTVTYNFLGFAPNSSEKKANRKAGVRSWMRPTFTMRLTAYTDNADEAASACSYIGFITDKKVSEMLTIPDAYDGIGESGLLVTMSDVSDTVSGHRDWLIVGANMEVFGGLYKVTADLLLSGVAGWDQDIYAKLKNGHI